MSSARRPGSSEDLLASSEQRNDFVNQLRDEVRIWRKAGYPGTAVVTRRLLEWWFERDEERRGGPIEEIRPGDVIWFPSGEKHWHGATPTTAMTHIAIQEQLDGKTVDWMEKVSDEQYQS